MTNSICILITLFSFCSIRGIANEKPFVIGKLNCQLGNNLFQIATVCAHAWDHGAEPYFPDLAKKKTEGMPTNYQHVLFRCNANNPPKHPQFYWKQPIESNFSYYKIPYHPNMKITGVFQTEKLFAHHRGKLLKLFAPSQEISNYIKLNYGHLLDQPNTVGVQVRWFGGQNDVPWWYILAQYGYDFFNKAMARFPKNSLFIVSTNNLKFAKENIPKWPQNVVFLENEPYYIEFFILSMCKNNIISNSTFGWWAAWLNQNPKKKVIAPFHWINTDWQKRMPAEDIWPDKWIRIDAKWGKPSDPINSFRG